MQNKNIIIAGVIILILIGIGLAFYFFQGRAVDEPDGETQKNILTKEYFSITGKKDLSRIN